MEYVYKKVGSIIFGMLSPDNIKKMAATKLVTPELYDKEGYPVDGGLMDTHLGIIDPGLRCKTCAGKLKECPGHFGYIELARPIIHIKYAPLILNVLRGTCKVCSRVLLGDQDIAKYKEILPIIEAEKGAEEARRKSKEIFSSIKNTKKCPHCGERQYVIKIEKPTTFFEKDKRLSPVEIRLRLEKVPDSDLVLLGLNPYYARPEWIVLNVLAIPPVTIRPSITLESGERSEDDLTHKLGDIVRINQRLFENINAGAPEIIIEDLWDLLQYHITTYFDNSTVQVPPARHRSGQVLKTLTERIKSKEGRFRHNLAGKRVNFAARTVVSPDTEIKFNEVGIPKIVAMELTIPETVTDWNKEYLKKLIEKGPTIYPGANYIVRPDGKKKKITEETKQQLIEELENGYVVERHLVDSDIAIFNRQPSLHRMSIMCHKIKVLGGKSFRLNPSVCEPYNADFDGDEMNLHVPQGEEARAEADILMQVQTQIMSPTHGKNIIGCVEDSVSGVYLLTKDMELTREEASQLLLSIGFENFEFKKEKIGGKEVFSALLPKDFNYIGYAKKYTKCPQCSEGIKHKCEFDTYVVVKNGQLQCGLIDSNSIGTEHGALIRALVIKYGEDVTIDIIGRIFKLGIKTLLKRGFSTGLDDTDLPEELKEKIEDLLQESDEKVSEFIDMYKKDKLEALPGKTIVETLEVRLLEILNKVRNKIGNIITENSSAENPSIIMAVSGAKGNLLNLAQMAACVGQQALGGKRIEKGYLNRTLPIFKENDLGPEARGFIRNGFKEGLLPYEFFFHAMTGRDALMDTALRTPKSGYLYRRLSNALQDLKVEYDGTVRDAKKAIVQFKYGEDNVDVSRSDNGKINIRKIIDDVTGE
ncbi:DNA-directed RNA polymerase subunit A' [Candidatus Woesearchaeota archaeon]|nr:DNA-directed RNA polymerase subunit A' [Candidatus Woesearchaeota archaeon]